MDFLTQQEIKGIKQDAQHGLAKQEVDKMVFEKKLTELFDKEIKEMMEDPENFNKRVKFTGFAKKYEKKKRWNKLKENLRKIFGFDKRNS